MIGPALRARSPSLIILVALWLVVIVGLLALAPSAFALSTVAVVLQFSTLAALVALAHV